MEYNSSDQSSQNTPSSNTSTQSERIHMSRRMAIIFIISITIAFLLGVGSIMAINNLQKKQLNITPSPTSSIIPPSISVPTESIQDQGSGIVLPTQPDTCQKDSDCSLGMTCGSSGKCAYWEQPDPTNVIQEGSQQSCSSDNECTMESSCGKCWIRQVSDPVPGYYCQEDADKPYVDTCKNLGVTAKCISGLCRAR